MNRSIFSIQVEKGKGGAGVLLGINAIGLKSMHPKRFSIVEPHLGHANLGVDAQFVERTTGDIDFDGQVGRRIDGEVEIPLAPHLPFVGQVVTLVRLKPPFLQRQLQRGGPALRRGIFNSSVTVSTT